MISNTNNRTLLSVAGTTYDFTFRIDDISELKVYGIDADGVSTLLTTGFSISFDAANEQGTVEFDSEPSTYAQVLMLRSKAYTQNTDIPIRTGFSEEDIENALDHIVMLVQQLKEITDYCIRADLTSPAPDFQLPAADAGKAIIWNATADGLENSTVDLSALSTALTTLNTAVAAAQTAQTGAETAQTNAEAAQTAAEAAQAAAEAALAAINLASPGPIGNTTPSSGKFTTLEATTSLKLGTTNQGDVLYDNGTSLVRLTPGTSGHFLKTQGAGANPTWAAVTYASLVGAFTAGDYFVGGDFVAGEIQGTSPTKVGEVYVPRSGALRIKFSLAKGGGTTVYGQIYRNGVAVGTLQSTATSTGVEFSEDISGWSAGDLCQLYIYNSNGAQDTMGIGPVLYEGTPISVSVNQSSYAHSRDYAGTKDPSTAWTGLGNIGDTYRRTSGGASTTLYVKTGATTWTAK